MQIPKHAPIRRRIDVPNPAAGANWSATASQGGAWLVRGVAMVLTTSAAVANRLVGLQGTEGTDVTFSISASAVQAASLANRYQAFTGATSQAGASGVLTLGWPNEGLYLPIGCTLSSTTALIDVADQYSAIVLDVVEYPGTYPVYLDPIPGGYSFDQSAGTTVQNGGY
jgi:hypothetical protein